MLGLESTAELAVSRGRRCCSLVSIGATLLVGFVLLSCSRVSVDIEAVSEAAPSPPAFAPTPYLERDFVLFWANPTRAHPGVPLDFRFVVYEKDNQRLSWQLFNAPAGMSINSQGKVDWTPAQSQLGSHSVTVRVTREQGDFIERSFRIAVGTDDFVFVSTTGSDSALGMIDAPFRTIEHAMRSIQTGNGKTILLRGGTYYEHYNWERDGVSSPWKGKYFSPEDPVELRSYPGEWAILDAELSGHGFWAFATSYVLFNNLEVKNASASERGGIIVNSSHVIVRDTVVHNSHWASSGNCTGYKVQGASDVVLDHTTGYSNYDLANPSHWNSSNYLVYVSAPAAESLYILNSTSYGSSSGFKIKHAGPAKLVLHNDISHDDIYAFAIGSNYSSVRHSIAYNNATGVYAGISDPNAYNRGSVLIENNTIVNASSLGIGFQTNYFTEAPSIVRGNIVFNNVAPAGIGEGDRRLVGFWYYDAQADLYSVESDYNLFFGLSRANIIRYGNSSHNYSFDSWQQRGLDLKSIFSDPLFTNGSAHDFTPRAGSPVCGALPSGKDIGALGCAH